MFAENHSMEQYWWSQQTLDALTDFCMPFSVGALCAPVLGKTLQERGHKQTTVLDRDPRFSVLDNFVEFNVGRPTIQGPFDLVVCDPPFNQLSLATVFSGVRAVSNGFSQRLLMAYPAKRAGSLVGTFSPFGLMPTGVFVEYVSVQTLAKNPVELYANFDEAEVQRLRECFAHHPAVCAAALSR